MMDAFAQVATGSLVAAVWQGLLLAVAAWAGLRMLPKTPAGVRFAIWFGVFLVVAGLPVVSLFGHSTGAAGRGAWLTLDSRWSLAIAGVWLGASLVRAVELAVSAFRLRALWRRAVPVEIPGTTSQGATARNARICVSDEVDRPSVIGFLAPKILIPRWLLEKLTPAELEQIVLHEAGHLGRADDWMNLLQKVALVAFPLNPALAWIERRLCFERELACDERVLRVTGAPKAYAECLASLAEHRLARRGMTLALGALGRESELGRRVTRILSRGERMRPLHSKLVLGGALLGLVFGAVELGRCPELVGFSSRTPSLQAAEVAVRPIAGYGMTPVVYRPNEPGGAGVLHPTHSEPTGMNGARRRSGPPRKLGHEFVATVEPQPTPRSTAVEASTPDESFSPGYGAARVVQVVVFTLPDGRQRVEFTEQRVDQIYPYAAVATRDGWLVIQL
jgi:hypothetical protein